MDKWNGKIIAAPGDHEELERRAAKNQFHDNMDREAADTKAHVDYKREQHAKAAASHLQSSQAAISSGDREAAERHRQHFDMHVQALGHKKSAVPPAEVRQHMDTNRAHERVHGFKNHPGDVLLGS